MTARPMPRRAVSRPLVVVPESVAVHRPKVRGWLLLTLMVLGAFFVLIYARIALDRSAFVLDEIDRQMQVEEARYWELRVDLTELQSPHRISTIATEMGLVFPESVTTIDVPGLGEPGASSDQRWADMKSLLSAQP